jgi:hypothetical protein
MGIKIYEIEGKGGKKAINKIVNLPNIDRVQGNVIE